MKFHDNTIVRLILEALQSLCKNSVVVATNMQEIELQIPRGYEPIEKIKNLVRANALKMWRWHIQVYAICCEQLMEITSLQPWPLFTQMTDQR